MEMQKIVVHKQSCLELQSGEMHVATKEMDAMVEEVFSLMQKHSIPFYNVETHYYGCPGPSFPMEELELRLFTLEN
jgi:hypothetical protein